MWRKFAEAVKSKVSLVYGDYRKSTVDMLIDMKNSPLRTMIQAGAVGGIAYLSSEAPERKDFESHVVELANSMAFLPPSMRSASADAYVARLNNLRQTNMLSFWNLGVATLVFAKVVPDRLQDYDAQLQRTTWAYSLFTLRDRFLDVGYLGHWRYFEEKIVDYDIAD